MIGLDGHTVEIADVWNCAHNMEPCELPGSALESMKQSRAFVDRLTNEERAIYGINTGFGPLSGTRVSPDDINLHQIHLLHHLTVGQGELFSPPETRAIMMSRANALARGYSGIRTDVVALLVKALNKGILPEIPSEGSVGASGDLVPLAHMARMLIGLGHVRVNGKRVEAAKALSQAGLTPVELKSKEGLALVNGTSVMTGLMALATREASVILGWMELLTACLFQALFGAPEALCQNVHKARGFRGQALVAQRIADHLRTHAQYARKIDDHQWGTEAKPVEAGVEIQDPYSLRCAPQILGAFQEAYWHIEQVVTRELNATTDNPLIFPEAEVVIHGGNFYGQQIAMVSDYLRIGLIKVVLLAERQIERMVNWRYSLGLAPMLTGQQAGLNSGLAGCQLLATSLAAEARLSGVAASIQTIPTNANNQDVVSMGCISAKMTRKLLPMAWKVLAIEALALMQAADLRSRENIDVMGGDYKKLYDLVREVSPTLDKDRPLFEDIDRVRQVLESEDAQKHCLPLRPKAL